MDELASLDQVAGRHRLRFVRHLPHPPEKVWRALTEPEHLRAWFPTDIEGARETGAALKFVFRDNEGPTVDGEMITYQPYEVLEFTWGDDVLRFELQATDRGCTMNFFDTVTEPGAVAGNGAGWEVCLHRLQGDLQGEDTGGGPNGTPTPEWETYRDRYVERFGPELGTLGPPPA